MITLKINGQQKNWDGDPSMPLLWYLRDELGLTGTKFGCGVGAVRRLHRASSTARRCAPASRRCRRRSAEKVVTIEGLHPKGEHPVQMAWRELGVPQCGYCQTGQIMQAAALLTKNAAPTDAEITEAMAGNICRCGCYQRIHRGPSRRSTGGVT